MTTTESLEIDSKNTSALWGSKGELWSAESRLPDFSWAGYHSGQKEPPNLPLGISVKEFGARGDGIHDDTAAFLKALAEVSGAIEIPAGRYVVTQILEINRPGVVLRGAGPDKSILVCPVHLTDIRPDWGATTTGDRTSNYSWSGGMVWFRGKLNPTVLATITARASRGSRFLEVSSAAQIRVGQRVMLHQKDTMEDSLARHLYSDDPGDMAELKGRTTARLICRVVSIKGSRVELDRPLRFDLRPEWQPELQAFEPAVTESGIENLGFEFPEKDYGGHFSELGYNAIAFEEVADCWARNIHVHNADSGIFMVGYFCSVSDVRFTCKRRGDEDSNTGHHGVYFAGDDNLYTRFDYQTRFIHDISVSLGAGNVFSDGKGIDLCFDHHKRVPYENLFTNLDAGRGSRLWHCGGGHALGKQCAARGTFWNIRTKEAVAYPHAQFGPHSMNLVGIKSNDPAQTEPNGKWLEARTGSFVDPANLHLAQLRTRQSNGS